MSTPDRPAGMDRRQFLRLAGAGFTMLLGSTCAPRPPFPAANVEKSVPDLGLKIDENGFRALVKAGYKFELLPDAADKSKLLAWSKDIYLGKSSSLFKVAINKPIGDFLFRQAKLTNPTLTTNIIFAEEWGEGDQISGEGGFTAITQDETELHIIMWLKRAAWHAFKTADQQKLPVKDYYQGFVSFYASSWTVHELGHAGAENKALWKKGQVIPQDQTEITHPQIFAFQKQYESLYDAAGKQGLAANALLIGIEPTIDLNRLRDQIFREARQRGFE